MSFLRGAAAGLIHRLFVSPRIGKLRTETQAVATPTAGIVLAFIPLLSSFVGLKKGGDYGEKSNLLVLSFAYMATFLGYGGVVVITILAGIGGRKK